MYLLASLKAGSFLSYRASNVQTVLLFCLVLTKLDFAYVLHRFISVALTFAKLRVSSNNDFYIYYLGGYHTFFIPGHILFYFVILSQIENINYQ